MREGIILAAGYGKRLRPITYSIPKALFPFFKEPLIFYVMKKMQSAGIERFFVNVHYKGEKIIEAIRNSRYAQTTEFQIENELLFTGGGLRGLLSKIGSENALVHNVDIIEEFDYEKLWQVHMEEKNDITWILSDTPGSVMVDGKKVIGFGRGGLTFTGVGVYAKSIIAHMPSDRFHLVPWLERALSRDTIKMGFVIERGFWTDTGTPEGIFKAYIRRMDANKIKTLVEGKISGKVELKGYVYIGKGVKIEGHGSIENSLILGNTYLSGNIDVRRRIIYANAELAF